MRAISGSSSTPTPESEIAKVVGCSDKTLRKYFRRELDTAAAKANARVAESLFRQAVEKGNVTAQIFWLKTRARWSERSGLDLRLEDGPGLVLLPTEQDE